MATLKLRPESEAPEATPEFDWNAHYAEIGGIDGVKYLQGKNFFGAGGHFRSQAPENMWQHPETDKERQNRIKQATANKKFFGTHQPKIEGIVPQKVIDADRENRQALAAEARSG
jgi:hypothetical protein